MPKFSVRFSLDRPIRRPFQSKWPDGILVIGEKEDEFLQVKDIEAATPKDAVGRALELANRVLDQYAFEHGEALQILESPKFIEYEGPEEKKAFINTIDSAACIEEKSIKYERRPDGTFEEVYRSDEPVNLKPSCMDGLTFYRRACIAQNLHNWFEAFREFFRAIEWATTKILNAWGTNFLAEALRKVFGDTISRKRLQSVARECPSFPDTYSDLFEEVAKYLYERQRCELDHAKNLKDMHKYKVPFDPVAENEVKGALGLVRYVAKELLAYLEKGG